MIRERILTAIILIIVVFSFLLFSSKYLFNIFTFLLSLLMVYEWLSIMKIKFCEMLNNFIIFILIFFIITKFFIYFQYIFPIFWLYVIYNLIRYEYYKIHVWTNNKILFMGLFSISPFTESLYILYSNDISWIFIFILLITTVDVGSYFIGKIIGTHKMLIRISPNKTFEGLFGGITCAIILSSILLVYMKLSLIKYIYMFVIFFLISILSVVGDIFESMIKRMFNIKDSGIILPGHGGLLDRLDSYIPTLPIFVLFGHLVGVFIF